MAKPRLAYVCRECGAESPKWQGQCGECGVWNSLAEIRVASERVAARAVPRSGGFAAATGQADVTSLAEVADDAEVRSSLGIAELDRVLGGGLVRGSIVLVGGDPGIGKSTLLLQALAGSRGSMRGLYVTGEESLAQVAARGSRLGLDLASVDALSETGIERILALALERKPDLLVIDSIQTMWTDTVESSPGSVTQVRESAARLTRFAKESGTSVFLIGHVTKEGGIAGPRVLEHMVDAVLYFEGEAGSRFRILRAFKNRFGAVNELGVFAMGAKGLREVPNPSAIFLSGRDEAAAGSAILVTREGTRPLLVEVQALVDASPLSNPRRVAVGVDGSRMAMLLAVLHRHGGIAIHDQDVFVNVVGGLRVQETAADLPVLMAIVSSLRDQPLASRTAMFGEIGLSGEIRPVANGEERIREALHHGFERIVVPRANAPRSPADASHIVAVDRLSDALEALA